jgi:hypothetical protein
VSVLVDPQFVGLLGQSFQVHGLDGEVYALVSSSNTQINAEFVFLTQGRCPLWDDGRAASQCWSHPGSYLAAVGVQQVRADGTIVRLAVHAGPAVQGFSAVFLDGAAVEVGAAAGRPADDFSFHWVNRHQLRLSTADFALVLESSDRFLNIVAFTARVPLSSITAHGLLGQTSSGRLHPSTLRHIEGEVDDYALSTRSLFDYRFAFTRFQPLSRAQ